MAVIATVLLFEVESGELVEAELHDSIGHKHLDDCERLWRPWLRVMRAQEEIEGIGLEASELEDDHWEWDRKLEVHVANCETRAIVCNNETQGLFLFRTYPGSRFDDTKSEQIVYVEYLATAPWNRKFRDQMPRFKGVGTVLMHNAVSYSQAAGFGGRTGLHSLPGAATFYEELGFVSFGIDASKEGLQYFELDAEGAAEFLSSRGG